MSEFEFWKDIGNISDAILNYQKKNAEFNNRFINPWIRLGNLAEHEDRKDEVMRAYQHATEIDPDNVQNWIDLGDEQLKTGAYDGAVTAYKKAVELSPRAGWPLSNLALTLVMQGKVEEAIPLYIASIELLNENKDKAISLNRLGEAYRKLNDYEKAFLSFQKADRLDGGNPPPGNKTNNLPQGASKPAPQEAIEQTPVEQFPDEDDEAEFDDDDDDTDDPLTNFEKFYAQPAEPKADAAIVASPKLEEKTVPTGGSNKTAIKSDEIIPRWLSDQHRNNLVSTGDESKNKRIPQWLVIDSKESGLNNQGQAAGESTGGREDAEVMADQFNGRLGANAKEQNDAREEESVHRMGNAAATNSSADDQTPQVDEAAYEEYLKDVIEPMNILSDHVEEIRSQAPQAKLSKDGEALMAMESKNAQVWNELGNVQMKSGLLDDAIASYTKAIELERHFAWPYSNLALAYVQKGYFTEAILLYQRSIELFFSDKDKAVTWNRLGNVYRRLNDYGNAIAAFRTADELDPENSVLSLRSSFGLLGNLYSEQKSNYVS